MFQPAWTVHDQQHIINHIGMCSVYFNSAQLMTESRPDICHYYSLHSSQNTEHQTQNLVSAWQPPPSTDSASDPAVWLALFHRQMLTCQLLTSDQVSQLLEIFLNTWQSYCLKCWQFNLTIFLHLLLRIWADLHLLFYEPIKQWCHDQYNSCKQLLWKAQDLQFCMNTLHFKLK